MLERIQTEGVEAAYEASLAVCRDQKAPAPARATAAGTLFRVAGYFEKRDDRTDLQPHEMSPEQLQAAIKKVRRKLETPDDEPDDIFG